MNILVTCAGGPAAIGVIKSLRSMRFMGDIVSIDCDPLSAGFYLSDKHHVVPLSADDNFWSEVLKVIKKEKIDLILPTGDSDIVHFSKNKLLLENMGVNLFQSDFESIDICQDKLKFYQKCKDKFNLPYTSNESTDLEFPMFCKPKKGSGSRGVKVCYDVTCIKSLDTSESLHRSSDYIFQEYLPGQEYTIDVLCDMKSNPLIVIPRKRLQTKAGISSKGEIIKDEFIEKSCSDICKFLKLKGPVCLQMKEDENGVPRFIEVNPRFGGGTFFTTLAGVNFLPIILDLVNGHVPEISEPELIKVVRYYEEIVV
jgi:carbamoyl-phosphate synthase large subunit